MRPTRLAFLVWLLLCVGCSDKQPDSTFSTPAIDSAHFAVLETELSPATLVYSRSKYLGLFADTEPPSHIALSTRGGPRSFRRGQKLNAAELEECWLLLWGPNIPPWVVYLQH